MREVAPSGELVHWDEPKAIEGIYLDRTETETDLGVNVRYTIETDDGTLLSFFETKAIKDKFAKISIGQRVRIEYTGKQSRTKKGTHFKEFRVFAEELTSDGEQTNAPQTSDVPF